MPGIGLGFKPGKSDGSGPSPEPKLQEKSVSIVENGNSSVSPDSGYDGLSKVNISTQIPIQSIKTITTNTNGTTTYNPDTGYLGFTGVKVVNETPQYYSVDEKSELPTSGVGSGSIGIISSNISDFCMPVEGVTELRFDHSLDFSKIYNPILDNVYVDRKIICNVSQDKSA